MNPLDLLKKPFEGVIGAVGGLLDALSTTDEEKLAGRAKLLEIERAFNAQLLAASVEIAKAQAEIVTTEAKSDSWLTANWRPIVMLIFAYAIAHNYILVPILQVFTSKIVPVSIVPDMWELLKLGIGGYVVGRSAEKIIPQVTTAVLEAKKKK